MKMHRDTPISPILLVDDDDGIRRVLSSSLKAAGLQTIVAGNGPDAMNLLRQAPHSISLLITDMEMPGMSGIELAASVTQTVMNCPVLLTSGKPLPPGCLRAGWQFLAKPFQVDVFLETVDNLLQQPVAVNSNRAPATPVDRIGTDVAATPDSERTPIGKPSLRRGERLRVIIAEDDVQMRDRLCGLVAEVHSVVAAVESGEAVLTKAEELRPDIILLDITMPGMNGFAAARVLRRSWPAVPVLFVTQHTDSSYVDEAFRSGAAGFVVKRNAVAELPVALQQVYSGARYVSPLVQQK